MRWAANRGVPESALLPSTKLEHEVLEQIIAGALRKITEAGAVLAGGHSVDDDEPKFGLSVIGFVHPQRYWSNVGARQGDALVLTKPLGSGVLFNANLKGWVSAAAMQSCIDALVCLNREAAETMKKYDIHAATDVTGFGLGGHGLEMAKASGVGLRLRMADLPLFAEAVATVDDHTRRWTTKKSGTHGVEHYHRELGKIVWEYCGMARNRAGLEKALSEIPALREDLVAELSQIPTPAAALIGEVVDTGGAPRLIIT